MNVMKYLNEDECVVLRSTAMTLTRQTFEARSLAARYYTAPDIYDIETERIFDRSWPCVGRVEDVVETGDYFLAEIADECLIVIRGRDGAIRYHHNIC